VHIESNEAIQLTISVGSIIGIPLLGLLVFFTWSNWRRMKKIEKLVTPVKTDSRGVRYFPPHEDLNIDIDPDVQRIKDLRERRQRELDEMNRG
jgi:hypothetical protein